MRSCIGPAIELHQSNATRFAGFFINALKATDGDTDQDGHTSVLEAFVYATRLTDDFYKRAGRLSTEHALIDDNGVVRGIVTGDLGVDREGNPKEGYYTPGMELRGKYTLFAEGCRGHIGKQLINKYKLDSEADAQHYGIGIKEIWDIDPAKHEQGLVVHTAGWPMDIMGTENTGGSFLYHLENNQVVVGLIIDLSYAAAARLDSRW